MSARKRGTKGKEGKGGKGGTGGRTVKGLPPRRPQRIELDRAVELTQRYRKASPASEHGGFFFAEGVRELLEQPGCAGLRYYHGLDENFAYQIVLVGVDGDGNDIVKPPRAPGKGKGKGGKAEKGEKVTRALALGGGEAVLLDMHFPCPPFCSPGSPLL